MGKVKKHQKELELKYIVGKVDAGPYLSEITKLFLENGYRKISVEVIENSDEYFDTPDLDLYQSGGSLRIRKTIKNGKLVFKGTYKMPLGESEVYHSRTEIEDSLLNDSIEAFKIKMASLGVPVDFSRICDFPILNSTTIRTNAIFEKNESWFCVSFDVVLYTNHSLHETMATDKMIEIEDVGELSKPDMLDEIHGFITKGISNITINKQSKYERGINCTKKEYEEQMLSNSEVVIPQQMNMPKPSN